MDVDIANRTSRKANGWYSGPGAQQSLRRTWSTTCGRSNTTRTTSRPGRATRSHSTQRSRPIREGAGPWLRKSWKESRARTDLEFLLAQRWPAGLLSAAATQLFIIYSLFTDGRLGTTKVWHISLPCINSCIPQQFRRVNHYH